MLALAGRYLELTKPRITSMMLVSTVIGFYFGTVHHRVAWLLFVHVFAGVGLMASGTAALNQWWERETDARMRRTVGRPLPSGRVIRARVVLTASVLYPPLLYLCMIADARPA
jgi:protoheme IX farnesyltransferase